MRLPGSREGAAGGCHVEAVRLGGGGIEEARGRKAQVGVRLLLLLVLRLPAQLDTCASTATKMSLCFCLIQIRKSSACLLRLTVVCAASPSANTNVSLGCVHSVLLILLLRWKLPISGASPPPDEVGHVAKRAGGRRQAAGKLAAEASPVAFPLGSDAGTLLPPGSPGGQPSVPAPRPHWGVQAAASAACWPH